MFEVKIDIVEDENKEAVLCLIGGETHWIAKTDVQGMLAAGECDVIVQVRVAVAERLGLKEVPQGLPPVARCKSCGAEMRWCKTPRGSSMPIDAEPVEFGGNVVIRRGTAIVLKKGEASYPKEPRYRSHFATCPNSAKHRR